MRASRVPLALALLVVVVVGPVVAPDSAQPASRISLTAALVEHRSVDLGPYRSTLGIDFATYRGHLRSGKAPGQPLFAVPAYALARLVGAPSASHLHVHANLELWWLTFWSATLPFAVLLTLLYFACSRFANRKGALVVALILGFCTMLLPYAANLFGHDLAALCGFGGWIVLQRRPLEPRRAALAGLLAGAAVLVEYETAIIAAVLVGYLVVRQRRRIVHFAAGAVLPMLTLAWYQWRAFGAPWRTPAAFYNLRSGYSIPTLHDLGWMIAGGRGLWVGAPIALIGVASAIWLAVSGPGRERDHAIVALAIMIPYFVLCAGWSGTPLLEDPGPRYLIPALAFLAVPLAAAWDRVFVVGVPAAVLGGIVAGTATWSQLLVARNTNLLTADRIFLRNHMFVPTLWSMAFGRAGALLYAVAVIGAVLILVQAARDRTDVRTAPAEPLL